MTGAREHRVTLARLPGVPREIQLCTHDPAVDIVSSRLHADRLWEPFESRLMLSSLTPGAVAVDVGANLGYFTLLFALGNADPGPVYAFEPAADNYSLLQKNLRLNGCEKRVSAVQAALSDGAGRAVLHRSRDNRGDHVLHDDGQVRSDESVELLPGADYLQQQVDHIDVLKVDTQGTEYAVLKGLQPLLRQSPDIAMLVELTPAALQRAGSSGRALIELLARLSLPLYIVDHVEHRLVSETAAALSQWCDNVEATPGDEGFMNIFAGRLPPGF